MRVPQSLSPALLTLLAAAALAACRGEPFEAARAHAPAAAREAGSESTDSSRRAVATVTRVADGDSLEVAMGDGRASQVRLHGIDAPELAQAGGREARDHLRRLALGRRVELHLQGVDPYGRHLAVAVDERGDLGRLQIQAGHAWHNVRYAREQPPDRRELYAAAERAARASRLGLWAAATPVAPWDFKAEQRTGRGPATPGSTAGRPAGPDATAAAGIVGNRRSRLYHLPGCPGHALVSARNAVPFGSEEAARAAGYRRAPNC